MASGADKWTESPLTENEKKTRKLPRPHARRAHWQHYRIGPGRKEIVLKWIEPVIVGSGEVSAVKHRVS